MKKILLGTGNKHKIIEITKILKDIDNDIEIILMDDLQDAPEKEFSFNQNAYLKALYYHNCYNLPVITDDSGICAVALNNRPGVLSKRYSGTGLDEDNNNTERFQTPLYSIIKTAKMFTQVKLRQEYLNNKTTNTIEI
jgi:XTP/dITP diphosphohydrolase